LTIKNWQEASKPEDVTIHLGDVSFGRNAMLKPIMDTIPGKKWLVMGNHDGNGKQWYLRNGFDWCGDAMLYNGVWLTHDVSEFMPEGSFLNVHGHVHNSKPAEWKRFPHSKLLALEYTDYKPVKFDDFTMKERNTHVKKAPYTTLIPE